MFDTSVAYTWSNDSGQTGHVDAVRDGAGTTFSFFAPHFSTYTITPASDTPAASVPTQAPAAASVLKATGADMNMGIIPMLAPAAMLTLGCAAAVKKRGRGK